MGLKLSLVVVDDSGGMRWREFAANRLQFRDEYWQSVFDGHDFPIALFKEFSSLGWRELLLSGKKFKDLGFVEQAVFVSRRDGGQFSGDRCKLREYLLNDRSFEFS